MAIKRLTVNDKELLTFDEYDGTDQRATARELLKTEKAVRAVDEGGRADITVWFDNDVQQTNWEPPAGYQITSVSTFQNGAMAVKLEATDD